MLISIKKPELSASLRYLARQSALPYSYPELAFTKNLTPVARYDNDFASITIGQGVAAFEAAKSALRHWKMFPFSWTKILPANAPTEAGSSVVMHARFFGLWWGLPCRVLFVLDEPGKFGFAYGTLPGHIEQGEELFFVKILPDGNVVYEIKAFSKPNHWLSKAGYPIMRLLQSKFRRDSTKQMKSLVQTTSK